MFFKEQYAQQKLRVTEYLIALPRERESMGVFDNSKVRVCVCVGGGGGGDFLPVRCEFRKFRRFWL